MKDFSRAEDLSYIQFGKVTPMYRVDDYTYNSNGRIKHKPRWMCFCDCGKAFITTADCLKRGTRSCGCLKGEPEQWNKSDIDHRIIHGGCGTRLYSIWSGMKQRCENPKTIGWNHYGGRGIAVCDEWEEFPAFYEWSMTHGYDDDLTLDRKDNDQGYSPENCRWVDRKTQQNNRSVNRWIECDGEVKTLQQWSDEYSINNSTLTKRIENGMPIKEALTKPLRPKEHLLTYSGITKSMRDWSVDIGLDYDVLKQRINKLKWPTEKALTTPIKSPTEIEFHGESLTIIDWAKRIGIPYQTLGDRLRNGWTVEDAMTTPVGGKRKKAG